MTQCLNALSYRLQADRRAGSWLPTPVCLRSPPASSALFCRRTSGGARWAFAAWTHRYCPFCSSFVRDGCCEVRRIEPRLFGSPLGAHCACADQRHDKGGASLCSPDEIWHSCRDTYRCPSSTFKYHHYQLLLIYTMCYL